MDGGEKLFATFMVCVAFVATVLIGWGILTSMNTNRYELKCLESGKTIQYRTLEGQDMAVKECK